MNDIAILITVNLGTLVSIIVIGTKIVRFLNKIEFKTDMMWTDFAARMLERGIILPSGKLK